MEISLGAHLVKVAGSAHRAEADAITGLSALLPDDWIVFANIGPKFVPARRGSRASEVDCLILGKRTITIIDLKSHSGVVDAFISRPWMIDGREFFDKNNRPVNANNPRGFYDTLQERCFHFKDLFAKNGLDAFVDCQIVFSAKDVTINNPSDARLASRINEFSIELVRTDNTKSKELTTDHCLFALSHFTEGDQSKWPNKYIQTVNENSWIADRSKQLSVLSKIIAELQAVASEKDDEIEKLNNTILELSKKVVNREEAISELQRKNRTLEDLQVSLFSDVSDTSEDISSESLNTHVDLSEVYVPSFLRNDHEPTSIPALNGRFGQSGGHSNPLESSAQEELKLSRPEAVAAEPVLSRKPLGLKLSTDFGDVRQTFSHGRTNKVIVQVRSRRVMRKPASDGDTQ